MRSCGEHWSRSRRGGEWGDYNNSSQLGQERLRQGEALWGKKKALEAVRGAGVSWSHEGMSQGIEGGLPKAPCALTLPVPFAPLSWLPPPNSPHHP